MSNANKVSFRYNQLDSFTDVGMSNSTSALRGRSAGSSSFLGFQNTNYRILENIKSGIGEWNWVIGNSMANSFQSGYTYQDESREPQGTIFPFVEIFERGTSYTAFGFEPFSYNNELRYKTFQIQDNFTKFSNNHSLTFGMYVGAVPLGKHLLQLLPAERLLLQLAGRLLRGCQRLSWRTPTARCRRSRSASSRCATATSPATTRRCSRSTCGTTPATCRTSGGRGGNLTVTGGVRFDVANFKETSFANPAADALTFRDEDGQPGAVPDRPDARAEAAVVAARRHQLGRGGQPADAGPRRHRRLHR